MFDLFHNREKFKKFGMAAILLLVSLSMLLYLVPNYNSGSSQSDVVVAQVGKEELDIQSVSDSIRSQLRGQQLPPDLIPNYVPQMVERMIADRAMAYQASRLGFQVSDADLASAIRELIPSLFPDGKYVGTETYVAMLAQQHLTPDAFEADLRRQMLVTRLRDVALEGVIVTQSEIEQEYRQKNEKIKIEYVKVTSDRYRKDVQPSQEDMQSYLKINAARFQVPERKNLAILIADEAKMEQALAITDAQLQAAYTRNKDSYRVAERVHAKSIFLKTEGHPASDEPKIKAKAEDLVKQLRAGADFATLARANSDDPASATTGGDLSWVLRGQFLPEAEKVGFSLKPSQISDPVKTSIGYQIIQVLQHEDARIKPFDEVKGDLLAQLKKERVTDAMQKISDKAQGELQKDPMHPEKVAAEWDLQVVHADWAPGTTVPEVGPSPDFEQAVSTLKQGEVSQPVVLANGSKLVLAVVTGVTPARASNFAEVESTVRDQMVQARLAKAVQDHAMELLNNAKANGGDLEKAAKAMGLEVKTADGIGRGGDVPGIGSATYVQEGFTSRDGTVFGPIAQPDGQMVAKVVQHVEPDLSQLPAERATIRDQIKSRKAHDRDSIFESGIVDMLTRQGVIKIHKPVLDRLVAGFGRG